MLHTRALRFGVPALAVIVAGLFVANALAERLYGYDGRTLVIETDAALGYRYVPNQDVAGLGRTNEQGMRGPPIAGRTGGCAIRILLIGDSIISDGTVAGQLSEPLARTLPLPVEVTLAAMGGWAPSNQRGYVERHGWQDADIVAFVTNSHDLRQNNPIPGRLAPRIPAVTPLAPVIEFVNQRMIARLWNATKTVPPRSSEAERTLTVLYDDATSVAGAVIVFHNRVVGEIDPSDTSPRAVKDRPLGDRLADLIAARNVGYVDLGSVMAPDAPGGPAYVDTIHLSDEGQRRLLVAMTEALAPAVQRAADAKESICRPRAAAAMRG